MPKNAQFGEFLKKTEVCGQTVLPDGSNWWKMPKIEKNMNCFKYRW